MAYGTFPVNENLVVRSVLERGRRTSHMRLIRATPIKSVTFIAKATWYQRGSIGYSKWVALALMSQSTGYGESN